MLMPNTRLKTHMSLSAALLSAGLLAGITAPVLAKDTTPAYEGRWSRNDGKARVVIAPCGDDACAINEWIKPGVNDEKKGDKLVMTVKPDGESKWAGKAFDPQRNLTYKLTMQVADDTMTTCGCVLGGLICKKVTWKRLEQAG
ncbi:MAG: DUF2147 domain-containing protein [Asticcacaulis sp.]